MERIEAKIRIRRLELGDVDRIVAIQGSSPEAAAWNRQAYQEILAGTGLNRCLVADISHADVEHEAAGFACFRIVETQAELLNLAVLPAYRELGIGTRLLEEIIHEVTDSGAEEIFLEVRDSNTVALELYERFDFEVSSRRPGYYQNPPSDALVLRLEL